MERRRFLAGAGLAAGAAAAPVGRARAGHAAPLEAAERQPLGHPHMALLTRFATNVDKMSTGGSRSRCSRAAAIVKPDAILEAVNKGVVDCGPVVDPLRHGQAPGGGLFSAPLGGSGSGLDQMGQLAWYMNGGGRALYLEYYQQMLKSDVCRSCTHPTVPECFGWFKKPITSVAEFTKLRFRISSGLPVRRPEGHGGRAR
jgi:TRAP-type mannitol/chloroaromatic compound transport system substrate-binding protein